MSVRIADGMDVGYGGPLFVLAGPCVAEGLDLCRAVAQEASTVCADLGLPFVFKASFDKANRTSGSSFRGTGLDAGLEILESIRREFGCPIVTDIHETWQVAPVAQVVDVLQIPAFLCRQTDLVIAAAETGKAVNIKKGQFLAPWDMKNVADKVAATGNPNLLLTERGTSFGYNTLIVDMKGLPILRALGYPVVFDATHSVQLPGGQGTSTGGQRSAIAPQMRAAVAAGVDGLFIEVHPDPDAALSDSATMLPLDQLRSLLTVAKELDTVVRNHHG